MEDSEKWQGQMYRRAQPRASNWEVEAANFHRKYANALFYIWNVFTHGRRSVVNL